MPILSDRLDGKIKVTANVRNLHKFLGRKRDFATCIKNRIESYGFEDIGYLTLHRKVERQILIEYHVTLDMAKELGMVEKTEKGRQARRYFIQRDEKLRTLEGIGHFPTKSDEKLSNDLRATGEQLGKIENQISEVQKFLRKLREVRKQCCKHIIVLSTLSLPESQSSKTV